MTVQIESFCCSNFLEKFDRLNECSVFTKEQKLHLHLKVFNFNMSFFHIFLQKNFEEAKLPKTCCFRFEVLLTGPGFSKLNFNILDRILIKTHLEEY